ncbi:hypothetical protein PFISCL1PPCAC_3531, partial [Pristionchus fissidentatus]
LQSKRSGKQTNKMHSDDDQEEHVNRKKDDWAVECICGGTEDDGEDMVGCDNCIRWQHVDCLFPVTKKADDRNFVCTVCDPRPTALTNDQARAYQERRKEQERKDKEEEARRTLAERKRRKEDDMLRSVVPSVRPPHAWGAAGNKTPHSSFSTGIPYDYKTIEKNEYSDNARRLRAISRSSGAPSADSQILKKLRDEPRMRNLIATQKLFGICAMKPIEEGSLVSELCGFVSLQQECPNRNVLPFTLNDLTFLIEKDGDNVIIDARKCGNAARFVRRSCKANAELREVMSGTKLHFMLTATTFIDNMEEVTIPFDADWTKHTRPVQGCACSVKSDCAIDAFYKMRSNE